MFIRRKYKGEITMFGPSTGKKQKRNGFKKVIIFFVVVGLLVFLTSLILKEKDVKQPVQEDTMSEKEVSVLTEELSKFMVVPDEEPLIFTISDVDFLIQEQRFFENASNGDILFVGQGDVDTPIFHDTNEIMGSTSSVRGTLSPFGGFVMENQPIQLWSPGPNNPDGGDGGALVTIAFTLENW